MKRVAACIRKDTVLCIALLLAVLSSLFVLPDAQYVSYIDFRTLAVLFCLMAVMAGLQALGVFRWIAWRMLTMVKTAQQLLLVLVLECFFFSMLITNDVALITFVPFTLTVLELTGEQHRKQLFIPVVVMETVAANLGSMLTPMGNPQNLYLYGRAQLGMLSFMQITAPYAAAAFVLLTGWCIVYGRRAGKAVSPGDCRIKYAQSADAGAAELSAGKRQKSLLLLYGLLFLLCLLTVTRVIPYGITLLLVLAALILWDRAVLCRIDYSLLLTFVGFFVFVGNLGRLPAFCSFLEKMITGREVMTAVLASQVISNVPAALLLSGFTTEMQALIIGTNLGGLGTLIASMASLISYKAAAGACREKRGSYLLYFTAVNLIFLLVLLLLWRILR